MKFWYVHIKWQNRLEISKFLTWYLPFSWWSLSGKASQPEIQRSIHVYRYLTGTHILQPCDYVVNSCWAKSHNSLTNTFLFSNNSRNHKFLRLYCLLTLTRKFWLQWSFLLLLRCTARFKHMTSSLPLRGKSWKRCSSPFIFDRYWAGDETIITLSTRFQMAGSENKNFN